MKRFPVTSRHHRVYIITQDRPILTGFLRCKDRSNPPKEAFDRSRPGVSFRQTDQGQTRPPGSDEASPTNRCTLSPVCSGFGLVDLYPLLVGVYRLKQDVFGACVKPHNDQVIIPWIRTWLSSVLAQP